MTFRIHFEHIDGTHDSFNVTGNDVDDIRQQADVELRRRGIGIESVWSEEA